MLNNYSQLDKVNRESRYKKGLSYVDLNERPRLREVRLCVL